MKIRSRFALTVSVLALMAGCAGGPPKIPYPAFIQVDELEDIFMASLPGVRAKQLSGDPQTRRTSNRIDLPRDWRGTSGGVPGRSMEIYVITGEYTPQNLVRFVAAGIVFMVMHLVWNTALFLFVLKPVLSVLARYREELI